MIIYRKKDRGEELLDKIYLAGLSFTLGMFTMLVAMVIFMRG
jgi:hypothetical protein